MTWFVIVATLILLGLMIRSWLIVLGLYKDPIFNVFERYGEERLYVPLVSLILWTGAFSLFVLVTFFGVQMLAIPLFFAALPAAYLYPYFRRFVRRHHDWFMRYPRWYQRLQHMTEREERRRLAYMWLRLPAGTRLIYNASDQYFEQWRDLVLLTISR
jgi:hypothetical protein